MSLVFFLTALASAERDCSTVTPVAPVAPVTPIVTEAKEGMEATDDAGGIATTGGTDAVVATDATVVAVGVGSSILSSSSSF